MIKKILLCISIIFLIVSCDYQPLYKDINEFKLNVEISEIEGDASINSIIQTELKKYSYKDSQKKYLVKILSKYNKISLSKDVTGKVTIYKGNITVNFDVAINNEKSEKFIFERSFTIKNYLKNFEQIDYENSLKLDLSKSITDEFVRTLLTLK